MSRDEMMNDRFGVPQPARRHNRARVSTAMRLVLEAGVPQRLALRQRFGLQVIDSKADAPWRVRGSR